MTNVADIIKKNSLRNPDKIAIVDGDITISYRELFLKADSLAQELLKKGMLPKERIALICEDSIDYIIISLAVLSAGAAIIPVPVTSTPEEINDLVEKMDIEHIIYENERYRPCTAAVKLDIKYFTSSGYINEIFLSTLQKKEYPDNEYTLLNPAFIRFSSGTTGKRKGVLLSHENIIERIDAANAGLKVTGNDKIIWVLSMAFHFVVTILLFLKNGASILLCRKDFPVSIGKALDFHAPSFIYASPFHYNLMLNSPQFLSGSLSGLRMAVSTAMGLPEATASGFREKFGFPLTEAYGIIEAGLPFINIQYDCSKKGSVGKILPAYEAKILNEDENGVGEILIKGRGMFSAYYSPWEKAPDKNEWFNTGDVGRIDRDGYLFISGRKKSVINFTGMKIFPKEVEFVINSYPGISESTVYGQDHPYYGQIPLADFVVVNGCDTVNERELKKFCYLHLAPYKVPKEFRQVDELKKTASGKIKRTE